MFKIYDGREHFYQWDLDRKLIVGDRTIQAVHFCNRTGASAITRDCYDVNGMWLVDVPNLCLQESYRLKVYGFSAAKYTTVSAQFDVKSRSKPEGYVYTDDEVNCWQDLDQRVAALEENPVSDEAITAAIEGYFAENPIEAGESEIEFVNGIGEDPVELDRTYDEIMEMIRAGKIVVIKYNGQLYYHSGGHSFRFVGPAETRAITIRDDSNTFYSETILPTFEDVEDTVNNAIANIDVGGECVIEVVNASGEETIELDKTYDEIMEMVDEGKIVVIKHDGYLYYQTSRSKFTYVGPAETRSLTFSKNGDTINYSETTLPTMEEIEDTVNNAIANIEIGGGIEIVNGTGDEIIELDKTYEEIMAMIDAGKVVVINYDGNLYHQFNDSPVFRYVGAMENRQISFNPRDYSVRYSENIMPTYEDVGTIVEEMLEDRNYQTAEQVNAAIVAYVGVIENGTY